METGPLEAGSRVPMSGPDISDVELAAVMGVLRRPELSIGPRLVEFEQGFAAYVGTRGAVGVASGTVGLHLCVLVAGIGEDDLVITTPFSFVASANVILYERAIPVFVDIDPLTFNIDPTLVAECVEDLRGGTPAGTRWLPRALKQRRRAVAARHLKAILPVHVFGQPADMDPIAEAARHHGLAVIEDACEAIGAEYKGRKVGTLGDAATFAFYPNKQMTTAEGGMIVTDRADWEALFRSLRNQGRDATGGWFEHARLGYNYRLDEMRAALGVAQLDRIEELLAKRERVAAWYREHLASAELVQTPRVAATTTRMSWFVYVVRLASGVDRRRVMEELDREGIPSRTYFAPIHVQPFYVQRFGYRQGDFPVADAVADSCLALPFSGVMTEEQVDYVCGRLVNILKRQVSGAPRRGR